MKHVVVSRNAIALRGADIPGYEADVLGRATRLTDAHAFLEPGVYAALAAKYRAGERPAPRPPAGGREATPDLSRTDAPSFLTKVKNFAVSAANHVAAGMPMAPDAEILRRHDICTTCEFFRDNACQKCGCPIVRAKQYVSKLSWADSECPVGKWGKVAPSGDKA